MKGNRQSNEAARARPPKDFLVVGRVVRPHGVRGVLLVEPLSQLIESLQPGTRVFLGDYQTEHELIAHHPHQGRWRMTVSGLHSREDAERCRDLEVKIRFQEAAPLDEHQYYFWQILELPVYLETGALLGKVSQIIETGANDVYVVRDPEGNEILLPAIESVILDVDLDEKRMTVRLLPGL